MIKKTKHPSNRGERLALKKKKDQHSNASPVFKLLTEREALHKNKDLVIKTQEGKNNE